MTLHIVSNQQDFLVIKIRVLFLLIRVGIEIPKVEVRFEHLFVEGDAYKGTRALPTLVNSTVNAIEVCN